MKYLNSTPNPNMMDFNRATSGGFQMYAAGGGASQGNVNSVLTAGEFVVSAPAAAAIGRGTLDNINGMRYSQGGAFGQIGGGSNSKADVGSINITVNVDKDGNSSSKESGGDEKSKNMAAKIKEQVLNVINEEKRVSGSYLQGISNELSKKEFQYNRDHITEEFPYSYFVTERKQFNVVRPFTGTTILTGTKDGSVMKTFLNPSTTPGQFNIGTIGLAGSDPGMLVKANKPFQLHDNNEHQHAISLQYSGTGFWFFIG